MSRRLRNTAALAVVAMALIVATGDANAVGLRPLLQNRIDPDATYQTIVTEHFEIHYALALEDVARTVAARAEAVHNKVAAALDWEAEGRTHIVVVHRSDQTGVFTFVYPHRQIYFDIALPHQGIGLNEYGNWHDWLLTHEYTHIAHLEMRRGAYDPWSRLLGAWVRPNMTTPAWVKEGIAVWAESNLTAHGRGESSEYRMMMRTAVQEGVLRDVDFASLDTIGNYGAKTWPWSMRPYIFGYYLIRTLAAHGPSAVSDFAWATAGTRLFDLDPAIREVTGWSTKTWWTRTLDQIEREATAELAILEQDPITPLQYVTNTGYLYYGPRVSPNGRWLAVTRENPSDDNAILRFDLDGDEVSDPEVLVERTSGTQASFSGSSRFLVFDETSRHARDYLVSDVYVYDLVARHYVAASPFFRARDADVHPDGQHLVFVGNDAGKNQLYVSNTAFEEVTDMLGDVGYKRLSGPRFSPSGEQIVLSVHDDASGGEDLWLVGPKGTEVLIADGSRNRQPTWTADGRFVLFSSDRTGVFNIHAIDVEANRMFRMTHTTGGLFFPSADPDGRWVYTVSYRAKGYDVARFRWRPETWEEAPQLLPRRSVTAEVEPAPTIATAAEAYAPAGEMWPQYVMPSIVIRPDTYQIGASVGATDPLFFHHYDLTLRFDRVTRLPVGRFFYYNGSLPWAWDLTLGHDAVPTGVERSLRRTMSGRLAVNIPLSEHGAHFFLRPAAWVEHVASKTSSLFPGASVALTYDTQFRQIGYSFPETGALLEGELRQSIGAATTTSIVGRLKWHTPLWWKRHVLHLTAEGGGFVAGADEPNAQFFAGGRLAFPFGLSSNYVMNGYPPNRLFGSALAVGTLHYTLSIVDIQRGFTGVPFDFGRLSAGVRVQAGWVAGLDPSIGLENGVPTSVGFEVYQEFVAGGIFGFTAQLGVYRGDARWGGETQVLFSLVAE